MTNKIDLPHKTMFEACNPGTKLVSESQVAAGHQSLHRPNLRRHCRPSRWHPPPSRSQRR